jgi:hypothetical protein
MTMSRDPIAIVMNAFSFQRTFKMTTKATLTQLITRGHVHHVCSDMYSSMTRERLRSSRCQAEGEIS